ncbi:hypothetical protein [Polaromonas jejuensis]|uniref:Uncharacterized protein n=1 Tax=Polaromonas jejuensis TaxID=457502 RepID=A0ABW0QAU3_9BURK|nr:hypothetical protein [Polaromonas jejuensis]
MINPSATNRKIVATPAGAPDLAVVKSSTQPRATAPTTVAAPELPSSPPEVAPEARKEPVMKKASVRKPEPKVAATKQATVKKAAQRKGKAAKPPAKNASAGKKLAADKALPKGATPKKTAAKKTGPLKAHAKKAVAAPPQRKRSTARGVVLKKPVEPAAVAAVWDVSKPKAKLVRDSFTMPQHDFGLIAALKYQALGFKRPTKKSELLRAGLHALAKLSNTELRSALDSLTPLKAGRPKKKAS